MHWSITVNNTGSRKPPVNYKGTQEEPNNVNLHVMIKPIATALVMGTLVITQITLFNTELLHPSPSLGFEYTQAMMQSMLSHLLTALS